MTVRIVGDTGALEAALADARREATSGPPRRCFACGADYRSTLTFPLCESCDEDAIEHATSFAPMAESREFARREAAWLRRYAQLDRFAAQAYQAVRAARRQRRRVLP